MAIFINEMDYSKEEQQEFLKEMLYQAIFVPEGKPRPGRDIVESAELRKYIDRFGSERYDICYIAFSMHDKEMLGAVWVRLFSKDNAGYGYVDENTPEVSIALRRNQIGKGIGSKLLVHLLKNLPKEIVALSLSVDIENNAKKLYDKFGFKTINIKDGTTTMLLSLNRHPS